MSTPARNCLPVFIKQGKRLVSTVETLHVPTHEIYQFSKAIKTDFDRIYLLFVNEWPAKTYCTQCEKFMSIQRSNYKSHYYRLHATAQEQVNRMEGIRGKIARFMTATAQPLRLVENKFFRQLFPDVTISSETIQNELGTIRKSLEDFQIKKFEEYTKVTLIIDEWTRFSFSFVGICISTMDSSHLVSISAPDDLTRDSSVLLRTINETITKFHLSGKVAFTSSDSASVNRKTFRDGGFEWFPCLSHILHNSVKDMVRKIHSLIDLIDHASALHYSNAFTEYLLLNNAPFRKMSHYCETRWLSISKVISRVVSLTQNIIGYQNYRKAMNKTCLRKGHPYFTNDDLVLFAILDPIFKGMNQMMLELETSSSESIFYGLRNIMLVFYETGDALESNGFTEASKALRDGIILRLTKVPEDKTLEKLLAAAFLNPFLDWKELLPEDLKDYESLAIKWIIEKNPEVDLTHDSIFPSTQRRRLGQVVRQADQGSELTRFSRMQREVSGNIRTWWIALKEEYKNLFDVVTSLLSARASSADIERKFSEARYCIDDCQGALTKENMSTMIYVYCNREFFEINT